MENKNESFEFTYSASQQEEIEKIRRKYMPKEADPFEQLKKLDQMVTRKGTMISIIVGVIGTLIFGGGMSIVLLAAETFFATGVVLGVVGFAVLGAAFPLYTKITEKEREKYAPQILELTELLLHK